MRCCTPSESVHWLSSAGIPAYSADETPFVIGAHEVFTAAPKESWAQQSLVRELLGWVGEHETALLWLTDWPFAKPDEMALTAALRRAHGEHRLLIDAPGHVFSPTDDPDELTGWIHLMMCFKWDAYLFVSPYRGRMLQTSHEDFVWVLADNKEDFESAQRIVHRYGLKIHREG